MMSDKILKETNTSPASERTEPVSALAAEGGTEATLFTEPIAVTVVMPVYNAADYLRPALDSVLAQTLREIEIICIDDGSTDRSLAILKEYQKTDSRIRIVTETNAGPAKARNNGLRRARGEYLAFLDADDFYEPTLLERLYTLAKEKELDIAVCGYDLFENRTARFKKSIPSERAEVLAGGRVTGKHECPDVIFQSTEGYVWNKLFRREFVTEKGLTFLESAVIFEDVYFMLTALSLAERIARTDEILLHHRVYSKQGRARMFREHYAEVPAVYLAVKEFLVHHGLYLPLSVSFVNSTLGICSKVYNLLWIDARIAFWTLLHDTYAASFGWAELGESDFFSKESCDFAANVSLFTYTQYLKREAHGLKVRFADWTRRKKVEKNRNRAKSFFSSLFGRKKSE